MLQKLKNLSMMSKLLYLLALILFIAWVTPTISAYYTAVKNYEKNVYELENISSKHGLSRETQQFSETIFKEDSEILFSKVEVKNLGENRYETLITLKKEDLKAFHTFIETISLRYYVQIKDDLKFKTKDETIHVTMRLTAF